jgi:TonB family protein
MLETCPGDEALLVKYDLRGELQARKSGFVIGRMDEVAFQLPEEWLPGRLRDILAVAAKDFKGNPRLFLMGLLHGDTDTGYRRSIRKGVAVALIGINTSLSLTLLILGLFRTQSIHPEVAGAVRRGDANERELSLISLVSLRSEPARRRKSVVGNSQVGAKVYESTPALHSDPAGYTTLLPQLPTRALPLVLPFSDANGIAGANSSGPGMEHGPGNGLGASGAPDSDPQEAAASAPAEEEEIPWVSERFRPTIVHKEPARYTEQARQNQVAGTVVLSATFSADGCIRDIRVLHGLPNGLTEKAIEAAHRIRFRPAIRDGVAISVRASLEYSFVLY